MNKKINTDQKLIFADTKRHLGGELWLPRGGKASGAESVGNFQQKTALVDGSSTSSLTRFVNTLNELDPKNTNNITNCANFVKSENSVDPTGIEPVRPIFLGSAPKPGGPTPSSTLPYLRKIATVCFAVLAMTKKVAVMAIFILSFWLVQNLFFIKPAHAASVSWDGGSAGEWNTGTNWSNDQVPTSSDDVTKELFKICQH